MGYVPVANTALGTRFVVWLLEQLLTTPSVSVDAEVVAKPFRKSVNPSARDEVTKEKDRDYGL